MKMTTKQAFCIGFLARCAEQGLTPRGVANKIQKAASLLSKKGGITDALSNVLRLGTALGIAVPVGIGGGAGYLLGKMQESPVDKESFQKKELLREYQRLARVAKQQTKLKRLRQRN